MDIYERSLEIHKRNRGKLGVALKVPLETKDDLSLAYSPGVAAVSMAIGKDTSLAKTHTLKGNSVAIVSDGSAILGLGNLGPEAALPVMEGKAALMKRFADIDAFPICLDTQNEEEIIQIVKALAPTFGAINLEDISAPRCFTIERKLRESMSIPVMHDDQHGTAIVVLAGLINSLKLAGKQKETVKVVISGAGAAGTAVAQLLSHYGFAHIIVCDSKGAISKSREDLNDVKKELLTYTNHKNMSGSLEKVIGGADIFIGVSKAKLVTEEMIKSMNEKPIIFAMANPEPEIMPELAKEAGAFIVATGRSDYPNQVNNALVFPGLFRGALDNNIVQFTEDMFVRSAEALASATTGLSPEKIIPNIFEPSLSEKIAKAVY